MIFFTCDTNKAEKIRLISQLKDALLAKDWSLGIISSINEHNRDAIHQQLNTVGQSLSFISHGCDTETALNFKPSPLAHIILTSNPSLEQALKNIDPKLSVLVINAENSQDAALQQSPRSTVDIAMLPQSDYYFNYQAENLSSFVTDWLGDLQSF